MFSEDTGNAFNLLTAKQQKAINDLRERQKGKFIIGISPEIMILDFISINTLRATDEQLAETQEQALFNLCNQTPSDTT